MVYERLKIQILSEIETLSETDITYSVICIQDKTDEISKRIIKIKKDQTFNNFPNAPSLIDAFSEISWSIAHYSPIFSKTRIENIIKRILSCSEYTFEGKIFSSVPLRINGKNHSKFNNETLSSFNDIASCFAQAIHSHGNMKIDKFISEKLLNSNNKAMQGFCELLKMLPQNLYTSEVFSNYFSRYSIESYKFQWEKTLTIVNNFHNRINELERENNALRKKNLELSDQVNNIMRDADRTEKKSEEYIKDLKTRSREDARKIDQLKEELNYVSKKRKYDSPTEEQYHNPPLQQHYLYNYAPQHYQPISYAQQAPPQQIIYASQPPQQQLIYAASSHQSIVLSETQSTNAPLLLPSPQDPRLIRRTSQPSSVVFSPVHQ